jgi:hypothetical protein
LVSSKEQSYIQSFTGTTDPNEQGSQGRVEKTIPGRSTILLIVIFAQPMEIITPDNEKITPFTFVISINVRTGSMPV